MHKLQNEGVSGVRLSTEAETGKFPWYDSEWLSSYVNVLNWLGRNHPERSADFEALLAAFRTRRDFNCIKRNNFLTTEQLHQIKLVLADLKTVDLDSHEKNGFDRYVLHNHELFTHIQEQLVALVSELVKEEVEPSYNFLSLYQGKGICPMHLDSPDAKWTLDICLNQSQAWPIFFSAVQEWSTDFNYFTAGWQSKIKKEIEFEPIIMSPGEGVLFSGSSQWHYRNRIPFAEKNFCELIFFHFIPKNYSHLKYPQGWARALNLPDLKHAAGSFQPRPSQILNV